MKRREAIKNVTLLFGGVISASTFGVLFDANGQTLIKPGNISFSKDQEALVAEIADVIIPKTGTPGAKAAGVGPFITLMIKDCYPADAQKIFVEGLATVNKISTERFKNSFVNLNLSNKNSVIKEIADKTIQLRKDERNRQKIDAAEKKSGMNTTPGSEKPKTHFFQVIRELTILGYFTSQTGSTEALAYLPIPGKFVGCVDLKPGQKAWAL
ncbi:gluconate 2-dehydrogenase subunit 3 family protein [Daejeonella sp.]|uniref:gluconate 2-dehydrogenase subunit 3 family protein n=1 Tax=Daejeonella sp. TaxID=2805397 RepID=UPI0030BE936A